MMSANKNMESFPENNSDATNTAHAKNKQNQNGVKDQNVNKPYVSKTSPFISV